MRLLLPILVAATACGGSTAPAPTTPASDAVARLRAALTATITSDAVDAAHAELARQVIAERALLGRTRAELTSLLGPGRACGGAWACGHGLDGRDRYYEIGRLPLRVRGGTPVLLVNLGADDRVIDVTSVHTQ